MNFSKLARRFLVPRFVVTLYYGLKYGCFVSPLAEVELSGLLRIGKGTTIGSFTKIKASDGDMTIGEKTDIGPNCFLTASEGGVRIGDYAMISANCCVIGNSYTYDDLGTPICEQEQTSVGVDIGDNVWIGCGTVVLDGAVIGNGAIVSVNSVVTGKIPPNSIAQGNPAKVLFIRR